MDFALSEDQVLFQDAISGFLADQAPLETVRRIAEGDAAAATGLRAGLADLGIDQILIPEAHGGLGLGLLDAALVAEALGAAVTPVDFIANALGALALSLAGSDAQQSALLPAMAAGEVRFAVALAEAMGVRADAGVTERDDGLNGRSLFVQGLPGATHILVVDRSGALHLVERTASGLDHGPLATIDRTRTHATLTYSATPSQRLDGCAEPVAVVDLVVEAGHVLLAADTLGAAQAMLDKAVAYARDRKQFNRVIGSFQAVKHLCAEMAAEIEPARALVWHAAYARQAGLEDAPLLACLAKSHLSETGTFVARTATEIHGGMGFTDLVGLHYWFKRIGANRQLLGGPERVREKAARLQGWG
ncbi:MAG: acyl-CoA dehydrogenase family protein [Henriciella sp.]